MQPTHWYVITGAPCSGKTSVIRALEVRGYTVVHEAARNIIDEQLQQGHSLAEIKADELSFESRILNRKIAVESSLPAMATLFLDRAVPDSIAYFKYTGLDIDAPLAGSRLFRYKKIFLFERLQFEQDRVRSENNAAAADLEKLLVESYQMLDYELLRVPVMPVAARCDFILHHL